MTRSRPRRVVVVGGGLAGLSAARTMRGAGFDGDLTVVAAEPHGPYDRPPLSKEALTSGTSPEQLVALAGVDDVRWLGGVRAVRLDRGRRVVGVDDGRELAYDAALLATGAAARTWPGTPPGAYPLRTVDDVLALRGALSGGARRVVVLGGGLVGCEAAATLRTAGHDVALVDRSPLPLARTLGAATARLVLARHRAAGVRLAVRASPARVDAGPDGRVARVVLDDGTTLAADVVVVALGTRPATDWLAGSGVLLAASGHVHVDGYGSVLDATTAAPIDALAAAGDLTTFPGTASGDLVTLGHWAHAREQARVASLTLLHGPAEPYTALPTHWTDQYDLRVRVLGLPGRADDETVLEHDERRGRLVAVYHRDGVATAAVCVNRPSRLAALRALLGDSTRRAVAA